MRLITRFSTPDAIYSPYVSTSPSPTPSSRRRASQHCMRFVRHGPQHTQSAQKHSRVWESYTCSPLKMRHKFAMHHRPHRTVARWALYAHLRDICAMSPQRNRHFTPPPMEISMRLMAMYYNACVTLLYADWEHVRMYQKRAYVSDCDEHRRCLVHLTVLNDSPFRMRSVQLEFRSESTSALGTFIWEHKQWVTFLSHNSLCSTQLVVCSRWILEHLSSKSTDLMYIGNIIAQFSSMYALNCTSVHWI